MLFSGFGLFFVLQKAAILLVILEDEEQIRCSLIRDIISSNAMDRRKILFGLKKNIETDDLFPKTILVLLNTKNLTFIHGRREML